jgi:hypothetical protein
VLAEHPHDKEVDMRSERSGSNVRRLSALTAVVAAALLILLSAAPAPAGTPPNRLDDNRGDFLVQTAVNTFVTLPPLARSTVASTTFDPFASNNSSTKVVAVREPTQAVGSRLSHTRRGRRRGPLLLEEEIR